MLPRATKQTANGVAIDGFRRALDPIAGRAPVVILGVRIGAVLEQDRDRPHETGFGRVVKRRRPSAVIVLADQAPVVRMRAMTQERGDEFGIVLPTLISCA